jgi:hypothetical protein
MSTNEAHPITGDQGVLNVPGNYQPIHLEDTFGAIFLGIFAVISLVGWIRAEARYRALITQLEVNYGNHSPNA